LGELGIDISSHRSKPVTSELLVWADYVVVVEKILGEKLKEQFEELDPKLLLLSRTCPILFMG